MRVHLRGRNVRVPQDRLHGAQVGAVLHHVRRAGVAQHVRTGVSALRRRRTDHLPHSLTRQPAPTAPEKEQRRVVLPCKCAACMSDVLGQRPLRRFAQRHDALLVSFSAHQDVSKFELQIFKFYADNFRNPQCAGIKHLKHGTISHFNRFIQLAS